jgi:hypothetical protein
VEIELLALQAGVDVLAIANQLQYDPDIAAKTIAIVKKLLHEGNLTRRALTNRTHASLNAKSDWAKFRRGTWQR